MSWYFNTVLYTRGESDLHITMNQPIFIRYNNVLDSHTVQYPIHNSFYEYKMSDGFLFHSNMFNALVFNRFGRVFYSGFANRLLSPFLFVIFIVYRSGMRPKHEHTVDTLNAYVIQCCSLIFLALFPSILFIFIIICTGDWYFLDCLIFSWYFRLDADISNEKKKNAGNNPLYVRCNYFVYFLSFFVHICIYFDR